MRCLDTRWQEASKTVIRRHACDCGVRGRTIESWDGSLAPQGNTLRQTKTKKLSVARASDSLQPAMYNMAKKQKHVASKSSFDAMDEDYSYGDKYDDIGIDIPRGDDW
jgi:hypothetical protein